MQSFAAALHKGARASEERPKSNRARCMLSATADSVEIKLVALDLRSGKPRVPRGHSYESYITTANQGAATHELEVTLLCSGKEHRGVMKYCGRGQSRDVWKGVVGPLGELALKMCDDKQGFHGSNTTEHNVTSDVAGKLKVPRVYWLGRLLVANEPRSVLLAQCGGEDYMICLRFAAAAVSRRKQDPSDVLSFFTVAAEYIHQSFQLGLHLGGDFTMRQCCLRAQGSVPQRATLSDVVLVDVEGVAANTPWKLKRLKAMWTATFMELLSAVAAELGPGSPITRMLTGCWKIEDAPSVVGFRECVRHIPQKVQSEWDRCAASLAQLAPSALSSRRGVSGWAPVGGFHDPMKWLVPAPSRGAERTPAVPNAAAASSTDLDSHWPPSRLAWSSVVCWSSTAIPYLSPPPWSNVDCWKCSAEVASSVLAAPQTHLQN